MKKIMFNDKYGLTEAVLTGVKTMTRRPVRKMCKAYPEQMMNYGPRVTYDRNHERREAYARGRKDERFETESLPSEKYWVAREKQGSLFLFKLKPRRHTNGPYGFWLGEPRFLMPEDMFPDITWESEPKEYKCLFREIRYESQSDNND